MKLINTNGMAFVGPGSEWFWGMMQALALAITFTAIYRQLRAQRAANVFTQTDALTREWLSERYSRARLAILVALRKGDDPVLLPLAEAHMVANFWENLGYLTRFGNIDPNIVAESFSYHCQDSWTQLAPFVRAARSSSGAPRAWDHFEWLARLMARHDPIEDLGDAGQAAMLDRWITQLRGEIRAAEELRAVTVHIAPTPVPIVSVRQDVRDASTPTATGLHPVAPAGEAPGLPTVAAFGSTGAA
jgi:hypothetical protein